MRLLLTTLGLAAGLVSSACTGSSSAPMPALAAACFCCHGPAGRSTGAIPDLAGMPKDAFIERMAAFREGTGTVMDRIVPAYSAAEVAALAEYFSTLPAAP
ncbi:MAG: hypothetical protein L0H83_15305 [Salinisphaera sp.]|nr:hypothetical protein [Salinisphaera sp.]